jgi:fibronectin type 3 domain-containing protein
MPPRKGGLGVLPAALALLFTALGGLRAQPVPLSLTAQATGNSGQVLLQWAAPSDVHPISGYNIYEATSGNAGAPAPVIGSALPAATVASGTDFLVGGLTDGQQNAFWVSTLDSEGESQPTSAALAASLSGAGPAGVSQVALLGYGQLGITLTVSGANALTDLGSISITVAVSGGPTGALASVPAVLLNVSGTVGTAYVTATLPPADCGWVTLTAQEVDLGGNVWAAGGALSVPVPCGPAVFSAPLPVTAAGMPAGGLVLNWDAANLNLDPVDYVIVTCTASSALDPFPTYLNPQILTVTAANSYTYIPATGSAGTSLAFRVYEYDLAAGPSGVTSGANAACMNSVYTYGIPQFTNVNSPDSVSFTAVWQAPAVGPPSMGNGVYTFSLYGSSAAVPTASSFTWIASQTGGTGAVHFGPWPMVDTWYYLGVTDASNVASSLSPAAGSILFAPPIPGIVSVSSSTGNNAITLTWNAIPDATGYTLSRADIPSVTYPTVTTNTYTDTLQPPFNAPQTTIYLPYTVQAYETLTPPGSVIDGPPSAPLNVTNPSFALPPSALAVQGTGVDGAVVLTWVDSTEAVPNTYTALTYDIYYQTGGPIQPSGAAPQVSGLAAAVTATTISGLQDTVTWFWIAGDFANTKAPFDFGKNAGSYIGPVAALPYSPSAAVELTVTALDYGQGAAIQAAVTQTPSDCIGSLQAWVTGINASNHSLSILAGTMDPVPLPNGTPVPVAGSMTLGAEALPCGMALTLSVMAADVAGNTGYPTQQWLYEPCPPLVSAGQPTTHGLALSWSAPSFPAGGAANAYAVYAATEAGLPSAPAAGLVQLTQTSALSFTVSPGGGQTDWYRVYTYSTQGLSDTASNGLYSIASNDVGYLAPPTQLQALPGQQSVTLSWTPPPSAGSAGLGGYVVYYSSNAPYTYYLPGLGGLTSTPITGFGPGILSATVQASAQSFTLKGLADNTPYEFAMASTDGSLSGSASASVTMTTGIVGPVLTGIASNPGLSASNQAFQAVSPTPQPVYNQLLLQWSAGAEPINQTTIYSIYGAVDASPTGYSSVTLIASTRATTSTTGAPVNSLTVTALANANGQAWYFINASGPAAGSTPAFSAYGYGAMAVTSNPRVNAYATLAPLGSTSLTSTGSTDGRVFLQWNQVPNATAYAVYRATQAISDLGLSYTSAAYSYTTGTALDDTFTGAVALFNALGSVSVPLNQPGLDVAEAQDSPATLVGFTDPNPVENAQNWYEVVPEVVQNGAVIYSTPSTGVTVTPLVDPGEPGPWQSPGVGSTAGYSGYYITAAARVLSNGSTGVQLEWTPAGAGTYPLASYTVYRGLNPLAWTSTTVLDYNSLTQTSTAYSPIEVTKGTFYYTDLTPPAPISDLYYGVSATDIVGNTSPFVVTATVQAPALWPAPIIIQNTYSNGQVFLTWSPTGSAGTFHFQTWLVSRVDQAGAAPKLLAFQCNASAPQTLPCPSPAYPAMVGAGGNLTTYAETELTDQNPPPAPVPTPTVVGVASTGIVYPEYIIQAVDKQGNLGTPLTITANVPLASASHAPPGKVSGLMASPIVAYTGVGYFLGAQLLWTPNAPADAVTAYEVFRNASPVAEVTGNSYQDPSGVSLPAGTQIAAGTVVTYTVQAMNQSTAGLGPLSSPLLFTLSPPSPGWVSVTADIPSGVTESPAVGLYWPNVLSNTASPNTLNAYYTVYRSNTSTPYAMGLSASAFAGLSLAAFTDPAPVGQPGSAASVTYYVSCVVPSALPGNASNPYAAAVSVTADLDYVAAPAGLTASVSSAGVNLSWQPVENAFEYWIYRSTQVNAPLVPVAPSPPTPSLPYADYFARVSVTSYTDTGAVSGLAPYYAVAAASPFEVGPATSLASTLALAAPSGLTAMAGSVVPSPSPTPGTLWMNPTVTLNWSPSLSGSLVTGYTIYRSYYVGPSWTAQPYSAAQQVAGVTGTSYVDAALTTPTGAPQSLTGIPLLYTVMAAGQGMTSTCAGPVTVTAYALPSTPFGLSGNGIPGGVDLRWIPSGAAQGVTGYVVTWDVLDGASGTAQVPASPQEWTLNGLVGGQPVTASVQALNSAGASSPSAAVTLVANAGGPAAVPAYLSITSGLQAVAPGQSRIFLSFSAGGSGTVVVYRNPGLGMPAVSPGSGKLYVKLSAAQGGAASPFYLTTVPATFSGLTDTTVLPGYAYSYAMSAVGADGLPGGESVAIAASPVSVTAYNTWAAPPVAATAGNARVDLVWTAPVPTGGESSALNAFRVYRARSTQVNASLTVTAGFPTDSGFPVTLPLSQTSFADTGAANGSAYYYLLTSVDSEGVESASPSYPVNALRADVPLQPAAPLAPPSNILAVPGNASVTLNWVTTLSDAGAGGLYNVYRRALTATPSVYGPPLPNLFHVGPTAASYPSSPISVSLLVESLVDVAPQGLPANPQNLVGVCYCIAAVNGSGEGPKSKEVCVTPFNPVAPCDPRLYLNVTNTTEVSLSWLAIPQTGNTVTSTCQSQSGVSSIDSTGGGYAVASYTVLRSSDGGISYSPIGGVAEPLSATVTTMMAFTDPNQKVGVSYYYRVVPVDDHGNEGLSYDIKFVDIPSGQNNLYVFRNSFDPATGGSVDVQVGLQNAGTFWVKVYTLNGEYVNTIIPPSQASPNGADGNQWLSPRYTWNGKNSSGQTVASGVYLIHLEGTGFHTDARVAVIK